ncbi:unnamed protein product [Moneuplotes crassus]|uniref:Uncharacterized protein n=1 Tax=Euplotes crassus TaxID=5936 RepID=A0AAD1X5S0_EUPCR|nr:unnamed protein product [Moneuplotes crassus]
MEEWSKRIPMKKRDLKRVEKETVSPESLAELLSHRNFKYWIRRMGIRYRNNVTNLQRILNDNIQFEGRRQTLEFALNTLFSQTEEFLSPIINIKEPNEEQISIMVSFDTWFSTISERLKKKRNAFVIPPRVDMDKWEDSLLYRLEHIDHAKEQEKEFRAELRRRKQQLQYPPAIKQEHEIPPQTAMKPIHPKYIDQKDRNRGRSVLPQAKPAPINIPESVKDLHLRSVSVQPRRRSKRKFDLGNLKKEVSLLKRKIAEDPEPKLQIPISEARSLGLSVDVLVQIINDFNNRASLIATSAFDNVYNRRHRKPEERSSYAKINPLVYSDPIKKLIAKKIDEQVNSTDEEKSCDDNRTIIENDSDLKEALVLVDKMNNLGFDTKNNTCEGDYLRVTFESPELRKTVDTNINFASRTIKVIRDDIPHNRVIKVFTFPEFLDRMHTALVSFRRNPRRLGSRRAPSRSPVNVFMRR